MSNKRSITISTDKDTIAIDTLSIVPGSLLLTGSDGQLIPVSDYTVNEATATIIWKNRPSVDSVNAWFRVLPFALGKVYNFKDPAVFKPEISIIGYDPFSYLPPRETPGVFDLGGIDYTGSFSRGLSFGNNQNVVLNSAFNLQMSGFVTEDIEIRAAITDENLPIQPDGTTQQIQDFDRVYIQVLKDPHQLTVGDYEIRHPDRSHFLRFMKRLQGADYEGGHVLEKGGRVSGKASVALARGKFARNVLDIREGDQGPYRLRGINNETFIIILAGTENVFVDGQRLERGAENDYVIDYNLGEVTFMPKRVMHPELRVVVEFEYSDKNYFRSLIYMGAGYEQGRFSTSVNFYSEQDNKNQPVQQSLNKRATGQLALAGDSLHLAVIPGIDTVEFTPERVLYQAKDTLVNGILYSIFEYSTNPDSARFALSFSQAGAGNGNYVLLNSTVNGRVYGWTAPVEGRPSGSYEPVVQLVAPRKQQMLTINSAFKTSEQGAIRTELAVSNFDDNTFSQLNDEDDRGLAFRATYTEKVGLGKSEKSELWLRPEVNYEFIGRQFRFVERFRPVEFTRDWNTGNSFSGLEEHLITAGLRVGKDRIGNLGYSATTYLRERGNTYRGLMHMLDGQFNHKNWLLRTKNSYLSSLTEDSEITFFRPGLEIAHSLGKLKGLRPGMSWETEYNKITDRQTGLMLPAAFWFNVFRASLALPDSVAVPVRLDYMRRTDFLPDSTEFEKTKTADTYTLTGNLNPIKGQRVDLTFTYRNAAFRSPEFNINNDLEKHYLGRVEYNTFTMKGFLTGNLFYEIGTGKEQRREYTYIRDPNGQGNYWWIDRDSNGIQSLDEFELAPPGFQDQALYIRVFTPTNEFVAVHITRFNQAFSLNPKRLVANKRGALAFLGRFSTQTALQLERKNYPSGAGLLFNPFQLNLEDSILVATTYLLRQSFYFNRTESAFGLEYTIQDNRNRNLLTNGFEARNLFSHLLRLRYNISSDYTLNLRAEAGQNGSDAELLASRRFDILTRQLTPQFTWLLRNVFRLSVQYDYIFKRNTPDLGNEMLISNGSTLESRYNVVGKSTLNGRFQFANAIFTGKKNTPVEFAMLQGLQPGKNYLWSLSYERSISGNIQITIGYEGRKTGDAKMVHTGRTQLRALF